MRPRRFSDLAGVDLKHLLALPRIRQRWCAGRFRRIFARTVQACVEAGIETAEVVHVGASLIRADVSWDGLAVRHVETMQKENGDSDEGAEASERDRRRAGKHKKVCVTDPDGGMVTSARNQRLEPSYKQHGVVDDVFGVVLDVEITTSEINEGQEILDRLDAAAENAGAKIEAATADAGYARHGAPRIVDTASDPTGGSRSPAAVLLLPSRLGVRLHRIRCPASIGISVRLPSSRAAVMTDAVEAFGKNVDQEAPDELIDGQCYGFVACSIFNPLIPCEQRPSARRTAPWLDHPLGHAEMQSRRRNRRENTRTGRKKPGRQATHLEPWG